MCTDACDLSLDPRTANKTLLLSNGNRTVKRQQQLQPYENLPERFDYYAEVLCKEPLTGRCYWECELHGQEHYIAVAYKRIDRKDSKSSLFGVNDMSWALINGPGNYFAVHNSIKADTHAPFLGINRVGVFLDMEAGSLSFYSVSPDTRTHLYTFNITVITEPLYAGFWVPNLGSVTLNQII